MWKGNFLKKIDRKKMRLLIEWEQKKAYLTAGEQQRQMLCDKIGSGHRYQETGKNYPSSMHTNTTWFL